MGIAWDNDAWEEYLRWQAQDRRILKRINRLLRDIQRNGKPASANQNPCATTSLDTGPAASPRSIALSTVSTNMGTST